MSETIASAVFVDNSISCHMCHTVSVFQSVPLNAVEIFEYCYLTSGVSEAFFTWRLEESTWYHDQKKLNVQTEGKFKGAILSLT